LAIFNTAEGKRANMTAAQTGVQASNVNLCHNSKYERLRIGRQFPYTAAKLGMIADSKLLAPQRFGDR